MDKITRPELETLLVAQTDWCVSLYMPTHRASHETDQNPIRFKNLLQEAEARLLEKGMRTPDVQAMLQPAYDWLLDPAYWQRMSEGLAVFLTRPEQHVYRLPLPFEERLVIAHRFHIKPLLPFFTNDGHFYILALSQNEVRLLEGTRHTVEEIDLEKMPLTLRQAMRFEQAEKQLQGHGKTEVGAGGQTRIFHGHDPSDEEKDRLLRWFRQLDAGLHDILAEEHSPLVLAGVEYLQPIYAEANTYPHLFEQGIAGNPELLKPANLHAQALNLVEPLFRQAQAAAVEKFQQQLSQDLATSELKDAFTAAQAGRIASIFVPLDVQIWGHYDPVSQALHVHPEAATGDEDLLDQLAVLTLQMGGEVFAVAQEEMPGEASVAAIYRY